MAEEIIWAPLPELVETSNVKRFMNQHGIESYDELVRRSTDDIEWFWDAVVKDLKIEFFAPYEKILDLSQGIPWAQWFVGGKINLAHNCLDKHVHGPRKDKVAVIWEGEDEAVKRLTYEELSRETNRLANTLKELGIGTGDAVGLFMPMVPEIVAAFLAVAKIGAILVPIFSGFGVEAVATRINDCEAKLLITADGFSRRGKAVEMKRVVDEAVARSPGIEKVIVLKQSGLKIPWTKGRDLWWHELVSERSEVCPSEPMDSEDPFMIIYTSGTTGRPKGSVHVHGGFTVKIAEEVAYQTDLQDEDVLYWVTDMGWIMGPWEVVGGLALGGTIFLYEGAPNHPASDRLWAMVERHRITTLGISPTLIRALMRYGKAPLRKHDLSSLRVLGSTGEPWNPDPYRWCFEHVGQGRCPIINLSGGTEIGACFLSPLPITELKSCTLRGPALGMDIDVFDESGKPVRGQVGELVCKKPWPAMTRGLWKDPDRYLETYWSRFENVWIHGDWAYIDEDGFWFLHGRSDDTIKIAGKRLGPAEVESVLVSHPAVSESAAIGVPHELKGEAILCYVVLRTDYEPSNRLRNELRRLAVDRLGKPFAPKQIKFAKELPKTRNAKILRRAIRAVAIGEDPGDLSGLENPQALEEIEKAV
ncbi:MAG: acetate--CoA ligase [Candidatus Bipolaricaulia bacterium]